MTKKFIQCCLLMIAVLSCSEPVLHRSKENYLQHFENFLAEVKQHYKGFSYEGWLTADKEFTKLSRTEFDLYEADLTEAEKNRIDEWVGQYSSCRIKSRLTTIQRDASHIFNRLKTTVKELKEP